MHKRLVFGIISRMLLIVSFLLLLPLGWSLFYRGDALERSSLIFTILLGVGIFCLSSLFFRTQKEAYQRLNAKDGLAIVSLSWLFLAAFGALPLYLSGTVPTYTDAFFEVTSGFTTTGATVITDIEVLPRGILFWRSLTHWLGGMGIIVLYLALLPALGTNAFQLYKAESPGITAERLQPRIKETAKILWSVYFLLSFAETVLLMLAGMPLFDALCHTFGTMATGGFSTKNASIAFYGPAIQWIIIVFMFLAGTNFMLHYFALRGDIRAYWRSEEFRTYARIPLIVVPVFALVLWASQGSLSPLRDAAFQVVSILTTTGYVTADFELWPVFLRFGLILLMFIGGCGGSTGGGMKVVRFLLTCKMALSSVVQAIFPNAVVPVKFDAKPLAQRMMMSIATYFMIFILLFFIGTLLIAVTERCDLITAFSASIACLSNIGPGLGQVGATQNYAWISLPGKWVLIFLMLAGRLELYAMMILLLPATWRK